MKKQKAFARRLNEPSQLPQPQGVDDFAGTSWSFKSFGNGCEQVAIFRTIFKNDMHGHDFLD